MSDCEDDPPAFGDRGSGLLPLRPGFEIRPEGSKDAGTMGLFLTDDSGRLLVLTAGHVPGLKGRQVVDGAGRPIGTVEWVGPTHIDAALFEISPGVSCAPGQAGATELTSIRRAMVGQPVEKSGRTTGCTKGRVKKINHFHRTFTNGITIVASEDGAQTPHTCGGDSGAVWFDPVTLSAVALHVAINDDGDSIAFDLQFIQRYYKGKHKSDLYLWNGTFEE